MKASVFIEKLLDVANNYKTLYVMGCFGAPMSASNKKRYTNNHEYNRKAQRTKMINAASADTFGFDCVNLIKGILWGWSGDTSKLYGGASYATNGVPDTSADGMIKLCTGVSASGWDSMAPGEAVWTTGHIGVYIGDGLAVECTPAWKNQVQITAVKNIGTKAGYNARVWKKHGRLPWVEYDVNAAAPAANTETKAATKIEPAAKFDKSIAGKYTVTASALNVRVGAGTSKAVIVTIPKGTAVTNYGYYSPVGSVKWLYVAFTYNGKAYAGFCSGAYLKK